MKQAFALYTWANSCYALKEFDEAARIFQQCVELSRELKNEELLFHAFNGLGNIAYFQKKWHQAGEYYQKALELAQHHASVDGAVAIAINLAIVLRHQEDHSSASLYLRHVIDTLEDQVPPSLHQLQFLTQAYLELAKLSLDQDKWMEARDSFRDAAKLVRHHPPLKGFRFPTLMGLARTAFHFGRSQEGQSAIIELEHESLSPNERAELEEMKKTSSSA